jgi:O-antigen/teichoic acid export membrane protein
VHPGVHGHDARLLAPPHRIRMPVDPQGTPSVDELHEQGHVTGEVVARSTRQTAIAQALTQGTRFLTSIALARILTPTDFGVVAVAVLISAIVDQFKDLGTASALIQRPQVNQVLLNTVFYLNLALGVLAASAFFFFAGPLATALGNPDSTGVVRAYSVITVLTSLGAIHQTLLRRWMRFRQVAIVAAVTALTTAAVSLALALAGIGYWALVVGTGLGSLIGTMLLWFVDPWRPTLEVSLDSLRSIWRFSGNLFLSSLVYVAWTQVDKVIVSRFIGGPGLGVYTMGQRVVMTPLSAISSVIDEVTFAAFSRRQDDDAALRRGFFRSAGAIALVTFPLMTGVAVIAGPLVEVVLGSKWNDLIPVIWVLAPAGAVQSVTFNCGQILLAKGRSDWTFRWGLLYFIVLTGLELTMVRWGVVGVATGYLLGSLILTPFSLMLAFRLIGARLRDYLRSLWPYAWCSILMGLVVAGSVLGCRSLGASLIIQLVVGASVGVATYVLLLYIVRPLGVADVINAARGKFE